MLWQRALAAVFAAALVSSAIPARAGLITDGDFAGWGFGQYGISPSPVGTAVVAVEASAGNPAARLRITTSTGGTQTVFGSALKSNFSTNAALAGAFVLSLDVLQGPGAFGAGQAIDLLIEQGGALYRTSLGVTGFPHTTWDTVMFNGSFNAALFTLASGAGPAMPDFTGASTTRFGFAAGNSVSGNLTMFYDNFSLQYTDVTAVPEPTSLLLLCTGAAALGARIRARRQQGVRQPA